MISNNNTFFLPRGIELNTLFGCNRSALLFGVHLNCVVCTVFSAQLHVLYNYWRILKLVTHINYPSNSIYSYKENKLTKCRCWSFYHGHSLYGVFIFII